MSDEANNLEKTSSTKVIFDLAAELTADELAAFKKAANDAGTDLTNHFLNITIRQHQSTAA
jgi:hypothetical protein